MRYESKFDPASVKIKVKSEKVLKLNLDLIADVKITNKSRQGTTH